MSGEVQVTLKYRTSQTKPVEVKVRSDHVRMRSAEVMSGPDQVKINVRSRSRTGQFRSGISQVHSGQVRTDQVKAVRSRSTQGQVTHGQVGSGQVR